MISKCQGYAPARFVLGSFLGSGKFERWLWSMLGLSGPALMEAALARSLLSLRSFAVFCGLAGRLRRAAAARSTACGVEPSVQGRRHSSASRRLSWRMGADTFGEGEAEL